MLKENSKKTVFAALMLALGIILPFFTSHAFGIQGTVFLPMHIPVLLTGFLCGAGYGTLCGLILPLLNSFLTGMPVLFPMAVLMTFELATYGFLTGYLFGNKITNIYPVLLISMISGRIVSGLVFYILLFSNLKVGKYSVLTSLITGIPGIILQLVIIPPVIIALSKIFKTYSPVEMKAIKLVTSRKKDCVVVKNNKIIISEKVKGIKRLTELYDLNILENSFVADAIIGKAAAMIFSLSGVKKCYGKTVSKAGLNWLTQKGISTEYEILADFIENRKGDGACPMESTVSEINDETEALEALRLKIKELSELELKK